MTTIKKSLITSPTAEMKDLFKTYFGPGRFSRTAYRIREQSDEQNSFGLNAHDNGILVGTVSFTPLEVNGVRGKACLLGPLLVSEQYRSNGLGLELMDEGIAIAREKQFNLIILVGDLAYYEKAGFKQVPHGKLIMPGPVDPARLLALELEEGALESLGGDVRGY